MDQEQVQPPRVQPDGRGYPLAYACYLHSTAWLLRKCVVMMTSTGKMFDKTFNVATPGLGEGYVQVSVCLPKGKDAETDSVARPLILVAEGGGFVLGQPSDGEHIDRMLCDKLAAVTISVDYAKSPRYPFPHALLQLYEVLRWALTPSLVDSELGITLDPSRVAVMGNSAGGNLSASLSLLLSFTRGPCARYREQLPEAFLQVAQILVYPSLRCNVPYVNRFNEGDEVVRAASLPVWVATLMEASYLPTHVDKHQIFVAPLVADSSILKSLKGAPALCITAGRDCLKYEAKEYVLNLQKAGCEVEHHECPDAVHGFSHYKKGYEKEREDCWHWVVAFLQRRFHAQE